MDQYLLMNVKEVGIVNIIKERMDEIETTRKYKNVMDELKEKIKYECRGEYCSVLRRNGWRTQYIYDRECNENEEGVECVWLSWFHWENKEEEMFRIYEEVGEKLFVQEV